jgi:hypothetical protein
MRAPDDTDDFALDQNLAEPIVHYRIVAVLWMQFDTVRAQEKAFDGGLFLVQQNCDDLTVFRILTRFTNGQIAIEDAGTAHRFAADAQAEKTFPAEHLVINHHAAGPLLLGVHRHTGSNPADYRQFPSQRTLRPGIFRQQTQCPAVAPFPGNQSFFFQLGQKLGHRIVADGKFLGRLPQAGQLTLIPQPPLQISKKILLFFSKHLLPPCICTCTYYMK